MYFKSLHVVSFQISYFTCFVFLTFVCWRRTNSSEIISDLLHLFCHIENFTEIISDFLHCSAFFYEAHHPSRGKEPDWTTILFFKHQRTVLQTFSFVTHSSKRKDYMRREAYFWDNMLLKVGEDVPGLGAMSIKDHFYCFPN